jgi:hypothetical protein
MNILTKVPMLVSHSLQGERHANALPLLGLAGTMLGMHACISTSRLVQQNGEHMKLSTHATCIICETSS